MKQKIVLGNWKMNLTSENIRGFFSEFLKAYSDLPVDKEFITGFAVPSPYLSLAKAMNENTGILIGSQNIHWENWGAYTGEISAPMLQDLEINFALCGHSERRQYFGETSKTVSLRAAAALKAGIRPVICIGETKEEFEANKTQKVIKEQLLSSIHDCLELKNYSELTPIIAYEPVWAIGTGLSATPLQAEEVHAYIVDIIENLLGKAEEKKSALPIIYGGSVNPKNANELMNMPSIDGFLVGGASLKPNDFMEIIKEARSAS